MLLDIKPVSDKPSSDVKLLGHDKLVNSLKKFIESSSMITPLSVAIHGNWGSGKTTIMRNLLKELNDEKIETIFFEAWRYEYSNPSLALISIIAEKYSPSNSKAKKVVLATAQILSNKFLGTDIEKIVDIIREGTEESREFNTNLQELLKTKLKNKKLVIIIDDLDRCDVENTLQLLTIMKLLLDIENCICITAVDFKRLQQAWQQKYQINENSENNGSEYLDKIFQVSINLSEPKEREIFEFINSFEIGFPKRFVELFSKIGSKNPRKIKKIINIIAYRKYLVDPNLSSQMAVCLWTLLENVLTREKIIRIYQTISGTKKDFGYKINFYGNNWGEFRKNIGKLELNKKDMEILHLFFTYTVQMYKQNSLDEESMSKSFHILYETLTNIL